MTIFVNRSIPLSEESRNAWRNAGAVVLPRNPVRRSRVLQGAVRGDILVNLGLNNDDPPDLSLWNSNDSIRSVLTPAAIRRTMPDLIPPRPQLGELAWFKGPGQHGQNKHHHIWGGDGYDDPGWDVQKHIEGTEYRVITVGNVVVQAHRKTGVMPDFTWEWVGVGGIKQNGIIPLVKDAVGLVPGGTHTVFGWDIIVGERTWIIEANSSPGVNDATARRIIEQIRRKSGT